MRTALVVLVAMVAVGFLLPVNEVKSVPLGGVQLVGEQRTSTPDLIAAGKNGNTGKNSNKNGRGGSIGPSAAAGGFFFGSTERMGGMGGPELVPIALR